MFGLGCRTAPSRESLTSSVSVGGPRPFLLPTDKLAIANFKSVIEFGEAARWQSVILLRFFLQSTLARISISPVEGVVMSRGVLTAIALLIVLGTVAAYWTQLPPPLKHEAKAEAASLPVRIILFSQTPFRHDLGTQKPNARIEISFLLG